jgi:hypothetical protein
VNPQFLSCPLDTCRTSMEVRRAPIGPGLWPGPRRQARRVGSLVARGLAPPTMLSAKRFLRSGQKGSSGALAGGRADPDNARRSGPVTVTVSPDATLTVWFNSRGRNHRGSVAAETARAPARSGTVLTLHRAMPRCARVSASELDPVRTARRAEGAPLKELYR